MICGVQDIKAETKIEEAELKRNLQSLACAKYKILRKHPSGRDVNSSDRFSFNADFTAPLQKIKISTVSQRVENVEERKETQDRVDEERKHQTEVCFIFLVSSPSNLAETRTPPRRVSSE